MSTKEKIIGLTVIIFFIIFAYNINKAQNNIEKNIKENNYQTICKVTKIESRRSFTHVYYYYYYNGIKYETWTSTDFYKTDILNRFYRIDISTENPMHSKILFEREIKDPVEITNAGFKIEKNQ